MFIPLSEAYTELRPGGEEREIFYFYKRNPQYPVEVKITRLPPGFDFNKNWHKHMFVEEFSVPLLGEIAIYEEKEGVSSKHNFTKALLAENEWILGIECKSTKRVTLLLENKTGKRRELDVEFIPEYTEGKNWHSVGNPTNKLVTMITLKRVSRSILKKDALVFEVDRESKRL